MKRRKTEQGGDESLNWMTTYSDLVTLLLCFFVLLFSFSKIDAQKFQQLINSFQGSLGVMKGGKTLDEIPNVDKLESKADLEQEMEDLRELKQIIDEYAKEKGLESEIKTRIDERGLIITVLDNVFFDSGKAQLKPKAKEIILYIGDVLSRDEFKNKNIKIEGHTDNDPINTAKFPSNWELSVIRATNVLRLLVEKKAIEGDRISASGYGPNRPVASNDNLQNKAKNRRVDVVVLKSHFGKSEPN